MYVKKIEIKNFRNLENISIEFTKEINFIYSKNGTGKTNLLEAIQCCSLGKSLRAKTELELINNKKFTNRVGYVSLRAEYQTKTITNKNFFAIETEKTSDNKRKKRKKLLINGNQRKISEFLGNLTSLWFSPESIRILSTSPKQKREYLDNILSQFYPEYSKNLKEHNRALAHKRKVFKEREDLSKDAELLHLLNKSLVKTSTYLTYSRLIFINHLNLIFNERKYQNERYRFSIYIRSKFASKIVENQNFNDLSSEEIFIMINKEYKNTLDALSDKEIFIRKSLVNANFDNWEMYFNKNTTNSTKLPIHSHASRGEQRMSLIYLQFALINFFKKVKKTRPVLLLDDIFSELDSENINLLINLIEKFKVQTIITGVKKYNSIKFGKINYVNLSKYI